MKPPNPLLLALAAFALGVILGSFLFAGRALTRPEASPASDAGRYQLHTTESGFFVVDTATGTVKMFGSGRTGTWAAGYTDFAHPPATR